MLRSLLSTIGFGMVSVPHRIVESAERFAFENPDDARLRGWTIPIARLEGVAYLLLARRTGPLSRGLGALLGVMGSAAMIAPRRYLAFGLSIAYENPDDIAVKPWVIPVTRVLGLLALAFTIMTLGEGNDSGN